MSVAPITIYELAYSILKKLSIPLLFLGYQFIQRSWPGLMMDNMMQKFTDYEIWAISCIITDMRECNYPIVFVM